MSPQLLPVIVVWAACNSGVGIDVPQLLLRQPVPRSEVVRMFGHRRRHMVEQLIRACQFCRP